MPVDFFKVRVWAVVGPHNAGKSSVVGALVSQFDKGGRGGTRQVFLRGGGWLQIEAHKRSIQEANITPSVHISNVISDARSKQAKVPFAFHNILIALRSDAYLTYPVAEHYLLEYVKAGWILESIVLLDIPGEYYRYAHFGAPVAEIRDSSENTSIALQRNWVFAAVRNHFGWA